MIDLLHQKPLLGRQINWAHPLARGLLACWVMNESSGSKIYDLTGNGNDGTLQNMDDTNWIPGKFGHALDFLNTDNDYIVVSAIDKLRDLPITHDFTVIIWFNANSNVTDDAIFAWSGTDDLVFYPNDPGSGTGGTRVFWRDVGGTQMTETAADLSGEWHQFVYLSRAPNDHEAYRDGVSIATASDTVTACTFTDVHIAAFAGSGSQHFPGKIDHIMIYQRALIDDEIKLIYNNPFAMLQQNRARWFSIPVPVVDGQAIRLRAIEKY